MDKPELLSPAGSPDALYGAVQGGADAVYLGGKTGNARANAKNFTDSELAFAIKYLHDKNKKAYITLNTLHTDREILAKKNKDSRETGDLLRFVEFCAKNCADAFILQDIGLSQIIREYFPQVQLHASTQAAAHNTHAAELLGAMGFSRVIAARELRKDDISTLITQSPIEIEIFVHGALCYSHSGRCFFSHAIGRTRSANRGLCAQPCRLPYRTNGQRKNGYLLSLKDLCLACHMREILEISPRSLKIEGRMKSPAYVFGATQIYRRLIDQGRNASEDEIGALSALFSRSGFTDGYFTGKIGVSMYGIRTDSDKKAAKGAVFSPKASPLSIPAQSSPAAAISRGESFAPIPAPPKFRPLKIYSKPKLTLIFSSVFQFAAQLELLCREKIYSRLKRVYFPLESVHNLPTVPESLLEKTGVRLPYVIFDRETQAVQKLLRAAKERGISYAFIDNLGHIGDPAALGFRLEGGAGLNITNSFSLDKLRELGFESAVLSPELTCSGMRDLIKTIPVSAVVYGRLVLMISENCPVRDADACTGVGCVHTGSGRRSCPEFSLTDRKGASFPAIGEFGQRGLILNSVPIYLADKKAAYEKIGLSGAVLGFSTEPDDEILKIIKAYALPDQVPFLPPRFTRGGF